MTARALLLSVCAVLVLVATCLWLLLWVSLPPDSGRFAMHGLDAQTEIRYDRWQRPYVTATTLGDALQIQGWLHASHRLWQMELLRRAGGGRLAQLLGADLLETDRELWRAGVPQLAARLESDASTRTLERVDRYLLGINAAIARYPVPPPEFLLLRHRPQRWSRRDVFAVGALTAFQSANNMHNELLRLALATRLDGRRMAAFLTDDSDRAGYPVALPAVADARELLRVLDRTKATDPAHNPRMPRAGFGSNGWVVSPARSEGRLPLYAFDSHDELGVPNLFYENHLFFAGGRQLRGWSVPGLPGVINGFNETIAWGFTNIGDSQDLYLETRSPEDPLVFRDGDAWYQARTETVRIAVAGGATETLRIVHTRNGPLISEDPPISLAWSVHRLDRPRLDSLLALNLAGDWAAFNAALDALPAPTLNATYADVHGTIGFRTGGAIPLRGRGEGLLPLDGADPGTRWRGIVPSAQMPRRSNPASGYLAAANARVNPPGQAPLVSADNAAPYRIDRLHQALGGSDTLSLPDMRRLQLDRLDGQAQRLLPTLLPLIEANELEPVAAQSLALLRAWRDDPVAAPDSAAALVFQQWYLSLADGVFADELGALWPRLLSRGYVLNHALDHLVLHDRQSPWWRGTPGTLVTAALEDAAATLAAQLGEDPARWRLDRLLTVQPRHELSVALPLLGWFFDLPSASWGGGPSTVGRARYSYREPFEVEAAATVRAVAAMGKPPTVHAVMPGGQSGHPLSPHYADQYAAWLAGDLLPVAVQPAGVTGPGLSFSPDATSAYRDGD